MIALLAYLSGMIMGIGTPLVVLCQSRRKVLISFSCYVTTRGRDLRSKWENRKLEIAIWTGLRLRLRQSYLIALPMKKRFSGQPLPLIFQGPTT